MIITRDRERSPVPAPTDSRTLRLLAPRFTMCALALSVTWVGDEFGGDGIASPWFRVRIAGVPLHYLLLIGLLLLLSPWIVRASRVAVAVRLKRLRMWRWVVLGTLAVGLAVALALIWGSSELFADWRNLIVIALVSTALTRWLSSEPWKREAILDLAVAYGAACLPPLIRWAAGGGTSLFDVRIPVFEGSKLYIACFAAIVCMGAWAGGLKGQSRVRAMLVRAAAVSAALVVMLSFRRTFWLILAIGGPLALWIALRRGYVPTRRLLRMGLVALALAAIAFVGLGAEAVLSRISSINPASDRTANEFSVSNADHINDLLDAWSVVSKQPIFGLGIGRFYDTQLIRDWKERSFEVHNPFLHVWLKFGLVGLVAYLGFYVSWVRAFFAQGRRLPHQQVVMTAAGSFLAAELVGNSLGTWLEGSFKSSVFLGVLLGCLLAVAESGQSGRPANEVSKLGVPTNG